MESLNYHHLRLFWTVAREGHLTRASARLNLTPQTVSGQIRALEEAFGEKLFERANRKLVLNDAGRVALQFADEIFSLGAQLTETMGGVEANTPLRFAVGVADVLPKLAVHHFLEPVLKLHRQVQLSCVEGPQSQLVSELVVHHLDLVLSDGPVSLGAGNRVVHHLLARCGLTFMARRDLAEGLRKDFPASLGESPALLPSRGTVLRRHLDHWFMENGILPDIAGAFDDNALLMIFGRAGVGFFAVASAVAEEVALQYDVEPFGYSQDITERFYALSMQRNAMNPAVAAICSASYVGSD